MITKKSDGSQVKEKESTDSSTTLEDEDVKGKFEAFVFLFRTLFFFSLLKKLFFRISMNLT